MYKWTCKFVLEVAPCWVADGFALDSDEVLREILEELFQKRLAFAYGHEVRVPMAKVTHAPSEARIAKEQGYRTVEDYRSSRA